MSSFVANISPNDSKSYVGQIIFSSKLDTEEKVKEIYGGTTWVKIQGRFLLGQSSTYSIGSTGGEATHTLTVDEMPKHSHTITAYSGSTQSAKSAVDMAMRSTSGSISTNQSGSGQAHNNMPPYKVVYIWERTA